MNTLKLLPIAAILTVTAATASDYDVDRDILYEAPLSTAVQAANDTDRDILYVAPKYSQAQDQDEYDVDRDILYPSEG